MEGITRDSSQSLGRGIALMEFLGSCQGGCSLSRIAEQTGLNKSTAHRLLKSLQSLGYVAAASAGNYWLTGKLMALGYKTFTALNVISIAAPHLDRLNIDTGDTVNFATRGRNEGILIYKLEATAGMFRTRSYVGQRLQLYCSGMGKLFLAFAPESYLEKYWSEEKKNIVRHTSTTIVDINMMRHELAFIRQERLSYDREENELGVSCIAAPIFDLNNRVEYAISIAAPLPRMTEERKTQLSRDVLKAARAISAEMGCHNF